MQYTIIGDTIGFKGCLVLVCGSNLETANKALERMTNNPTENDLRLSKNHFNLRINEVDDKNCWWDNYNT